jgi:hypothetical protein
MTVSICDGALCCLFSFDSALAVCRNRYMTSMRNIVAPKTQDRGMSLSSFKDLAKLEGRSALGLAEWIG